MSWNGSGTFNRDYNWQADRDASIKILAVRMDGEFDNYKGGLQNCITRDGQTPPTSDISWGSRKITNLANGAAPQDACTVWQANNLATIFIAKDGSGPPNADTPWANHKLTSLANGTLTTDAVNLGQVQTLLTAQAATPFASYTGTFTWLTFQSFRVDNVDLTAVWLPGMRLRITHNNGASTMYSTVISVTYAAPNSTVNVTNDAGSIVNPITAVATSIFPPGSDAAPRKSRLIATGGAAMVSTTTTNALGPGSIIDVLSEFNTTTGVFTAKQAGQYRARLAGTVFWSTIPTWTSFPNLDIRKNASSFSNASGPRGPVPTTPAAAGFNSPAGTAFVEGTTTIAVGDTVDFRLVHGTFSGGSGPFVFWSLELERVT